MNQFNAREVILSETANRQYDDLRAAHDWFEDSYRALEWLLARGCERLIADSYQIKKSKYLYKQDSIYKEKPLLVIYACAEGQVDIFALGVAQ